MNKLLTETAIVFALQIIKDALKDSRKRSKYQKIMEILRDALLVAYPIDPLEGPKNEKRSRWSAAVPPSLISLWREKEFVFL